MQRSIAVKRSRKNVKRTQRTQWRLSIKRRRAMRAPKGAKLIVAAVVAVALLVAVNWTYQVLRKPTELFFPVSAVLFKTPTETWAEYSPLFKKYATQVMTPDLLAAIAQVEGSGNPVVRTYWRWSWKLRPFEVYRPASSAVGMYQITDGTFAEAKRYCIREHAVVERGPWQADRSCWFNGLYSRVFPADAVELTSAYLDRSVAAILERRGVRRTTLGRKQDLATMIHLCGAGAGDNFVRHGFRLSEGQRCGDHEVRAYMARVGAMKRIFDRLAERSSDLT